MGTVANLSVKIGANTQDFNAGLNKMAGEVQGISSRLSAAGALIAGAFSLRAVGAGIQEVIDKTSRIADGAARIGVSAEAFQKLSFAAAQSGGSMSAIETAMRVMSDRIVDGNLPKALTDMGISLDSLKQMTPDQAFLTIANALQNMPNQFEQSSAAVDMFGRGAQALLPAIKAGFDDVAAAAPAMTNATVLAGDQMGDKWLEMQTKIDNLRAQALIPLLDGFLKLPEAVQIGAAGMLTFLPVVEPLLLAMIALGGPGKAIALVTGAFGSLATVFTTTIPAAIGVMVPFFTTTLPAAFGAVIAFLGPQGLIALALLALAAIWYKWGDDIKAFLGPLFTNIGGFFHDVKDKAIAYSKQLFEGVKAWLIDKFNAIVDSIRQKVGAVTGFFKDMYMSVVGGSIVPDMVRGVGQWFGQLQGNMVGPTQMATGAVTGLFQGMSNAIGNILSGLSSRITGWLDKIPGVGGILGDIFSGMGGLEGIMKNIPGLSGLFGGGAGGGGLLGGLLGGGGGAAGAGGGGAAGGGLLGGLSGAAPFAVLAAPFAAAALGGFFDTMSQEQINQMANYRAGTGQSAMWGMMFDRAGVESFSEQEGAGPMGTSVHVSVAVNAVDAQGVSEFVESDSFTNSLIDAFRRNRNGLLTATQDLVAPG